MKLSRTLAVLTLIVAGAASAQSSASEDKQKLVQRVLELWHLEDTAIVMVQRPAADALQQSRIALQGRVAAPKQEDVLREMIALLESPLKKKFEQLVPQFERAFGEKVAAESRAAIDPKLQAMTQ